MPVPNVAIPPTQERKDHSRTCNKCSHTESPKAGILFHKVKFGVWKAFLICFEMSTTTKGLSALQMGKRYFITEKIAGLFMHKVREAMESSRTLPMKGDVHAGESVLGVKVGHSYASKKKKRPVPWGSPRMNAAMNYVKEQDFQLFYYA